MPSTRDVKDISEALHSRLLAAEGITPCDVESCPEVIAPVTSCILGPTKAKKAWSLTIAATQRPLFTEVLAKFFGQKASFPKLAAKGHAWVFNKLELQVDPAAKVMEVPMDKSKVHMCYFMCGRGSEGWSYWSDGESIGLQMAKILLHHKVANIDPRAAGCLLEPAEASEHTAVLVKASYVEGIPEELAAELNRTLAFLVKDRGCVQQGH